MAPFPAIESTIATNFNLFKDLLFLMCFLKRRLQTLSQTFNAVRTLKAIKRQTDDKYILSLSMQVGTELGQSF